MIVSLSVLVSACGIFSDDEVEQPRELVDIDASVELETLWTANIGNGQGDSYLHLGPSIDGQYIYAAASNGEVYSLNKETGVREWQRDTDDDISGAIGVGGDLVVYGTLDAQIVALDADNGDERWRSSISSEVLAAPQTDGRRVVAQTVDGRLLALDAENGEQLWAYESTVPALSLRGSSKPIITGNIVVSGFANGMVAALDATDGFILWEERVAVPQGRYDIERIIDIDGDPVLIGGTVYVGSFQGNLMGLDLQSGRIVWGIPGSTYRSLTLGLGNIYWANSESHIFAIQNNTDSEVWENDDLRLRRVTSPVAFNNYLAVGDFEGYLHLLSQIDGRIVGRTRVDSDGLRSNIIADGRTLYVYGNSGRLAAYRLP